MTELTKEQRDQYRELGRIFMPRTAEDVSRLYPGGEGTARFAHYTSADAALKIIRTRRLWMRDATCMADYGEIEHGFRLSLRLLKQNNRLEEFKAALEAVAPGVADKGLNTFDQHSYSIRRGGTFIASLSEHRDHEDNFGRLSMWRAFGSTGVRVAVIVRLPAFSTAGQAMQVTFAPVSYATEAQAAQDLDECIARIKANADFLKGLDQNILHAMVFVKFLAAIVSMKHEAFSEEFEWRAVYTTVLGAVATLKIDHSVESINGVPQKVYHLPLDQRCIRISPR